MTHFNAPPMVRQEDVLSSPPFDPRIQQSFALVVEFALGDSLVIATSVHMRQRVFSRAVGAHDRVDFARGDLQIDAAQDFGIHRVSVKMLDFKDGCFSHSLRVTAKLSETFLFSTRLFHFLG